MKKIKNKQGKRVSREMKAQNALLKAQNESQTSSASSSLRAFSTRGQGISSKNLPIINVKNAEGDPDTVAQIVVQNQINYTPKVSVIIPVYNVEQYLRECLDSVVNQTLKEIEIICVDDGSTDKSLNILLEYAKKDNRITVLKQENLHAGVARNAGLAVARGEYLSFLDSDDFFELNMLEEMSKKADEDKSDVVVCGNYVYDEQKQKMIRQVHIEKHFLEATPFSPTLFGDKLFTFCNPNPWTKLFKHNLFIKNNLHFERYIRCNDFTCVYTALATANKISVIDTPFIIYRSNQKNNVTSQRSDQVDCFLYAVDKLEKKLKKLDLYQTFEQTFKNRITNSFRWELSVCTDEQKQKIKEQAEKILSKNTYNILYAPKVSVIIPVYNVEQYLRECLDSVINQTLKDIEIICVNDGSTDGSLKILEEYARKDNRIKIINQENQGLPNARNSGLKIATGEYIMFIDSDDWIDNDYIEKMYSCAIENGADIVKSGYKHYFSDKIVDDTINEIINKRYQSKQLLAPYENNIIVCATLYRTNFLRHNNILYFDNDILKHEDILYTLKATTFANKIAPITGTYYNYRRSSSILSTFSYENCYVILEITKRAVKFINTNVKNKEDYIKSAQRLTWRILDTYEKLNKIPQFTQDKFSYLREMLKIFVQFRYKKEIFKNFSSIKNLKKTYINNRLNKPNSILIIELNNCHGECLSGYIKYFQDLGYEIDVLINEKQQKENPLYMFNNIYINYASIDDIIKYLNSNTFKNYDYCLFNSNIIYEKQNKSVLNLINSTIKHTKILCIEHQLQNIDILAKNAIPLVIKKFNNNKNIFEVNPHYFGEFPTHNKNKITNFIVVGNIENKRKNYNLLISTVTTLLNKEITNFCITIVGKGNALDIPENIRPYFNIKGRLSYPDMYKEVSNADYFLTLLDPKNKEHNRYLKYGTSGSFQLIYGFTIPCLIAHKFAKKHNFNKNNSIIYKNNNQLAAAMITAISIPNNKYQKYKRELKALSEDIYQNSLKNLQTAINSKIQHPSLFKSLLSLPYYLPATLILRNHLKNAETKHIIQTLHSFRLDIKNLGSAENAISITAQNAQISTPAWFTNEQGIGQVVNGAGTKQKLTIKAIKSGTLQLNFRGQDKRDTNGTRFPLWVDYKSIKIDGKEILSMPIATWHDKPYRYEMPVKDGQQITVEFEQQPHPYTSDELKDIILKLNPNSTYIKQNINKIAEQISGSASTLPEEKNSRFASLKHFLYHKTETDTCTKTYICGVRVRKKPANIYSFIDNRLAEFSKTLDAKFAELSKQLAQNSAKTQKDLLAKIADSSKIEQNNFTSLQKDINNKFNNLEKETQLVKSNGLYTIKALNKKLDSLFGMQNTTADFLSAAQKENRDDLLAATEELRENLLNNSAANRQAISGQLEKVLNLAAEQGKTLQTAQQNLQSTAESAQQAIIKQIETAQSNRTSILEEIKRLPEDIAQNSASNKAEILASVAKIADTQTNLQNTLQTAQQNLQSTAESAQQAIIKQIETAQSTQQTILGQAEHLKAAVGSQIVGFETLQNSQNETIKSLLAAETAKAEQKFAEQSKNIIDFRNQYQSQYQELNFADLFHDTIEQSPWLKNKSFSLFGWAANYSFIYTLYRILDKVNPRNILEMGLGQTTRLTSQYIANKQPSAHLNVCEHNQDWINIYKEELPASDNIRINHLDLEYFDYEGKKNDKYKDMNKLANNQKFDLIIIDGPVGGGKNLPRSNILDLIKNGCIAEDFIIIFDDAERGGEKTTISKAKELLTAQKIDFFSFERSGIKRQHIITSQSRSFVQYL